MKTTAWGVILPDESPYMPSLRRTRKAANAAMRAECPHTSWEMLKLLEFRMRKVTITYRGL